MNIVTIGISPYLLLSHAKIHSEILKFLYFNNHSVAAACWAHDTSYFLPKENEKNEEKYYYDFDDHSIPMMLFDPIKDPSISVYEILKFYNPDLVITIGDYNDFLYMKAVQMFSEEPYPWLAVLANHSYPINEKNLDLVHSMSGILCTYKKCYDELDKIFNKSNISYSYIGCPDLNDQIGNRDKIRSEKKIENKFRVMNCGKNIQADSIPMIMEAAKDLRIDIPELELYIHSNIHDIGDFDMQAIRERFDPNAEFIVFPDKYVSLIDGYDQKPFESELIASDVLVATSINSSSGLMIFEALACGCLPLMSNTGCHSEIAELLGDLSDEYQADDFLISCIEVMVAGEIYVNICEPQELRRKILNLHRKNRNKEGGAAELFQQFTKSNHRTQFFKELNSTIEKIKTSNSTLCVESV